MVNSCSCDNESMTKKAAKFVTQKAIEAGEGVSEVITKDSGKIAESITKAAGELASGTAKGANDVANDKGQYIGENLGSAAGQFLSGFGHGLDNNMKDFKWKILEKNKNDLQVYGATKTLVQAKKVNLYIRFLKGGKLKLKLDCYDKSCSKLVGSVVSYVEVKELEFKAIDFDFGNAEPVRQGECMILSIER